jgi:hypothetical protein
MSYEQRDGSGALFKNNEKETENHPDYKGSIKINGQEFWLSAWLKESAKGTKYMSLSAKPKLQSDRASPPTGGRNDPRPVNDDFGDRDIPF